MTVKKLLDIDWVRFGFGFMCGAAIDVTTDWLFSSQNHNGQRLGLALLVGCLLWGLHSPWLSGGEIDTGNTDDPTK
jgi:hypothetical protein